MAKSEDDVQRDRRFGEALRAAREAKGRTWTQDLLAARLEVDQTLVSAWERGKKVPRSRQRIERIESLLGPEVCPPGSLMAILFGPLPSSSGPASVPAFGDKFSRLSPKDRRIVERLVDEMLGEE